MSIKLEFIYHPPRPYQEQTGKIRTSPAWYSIRKVDHDNPTGLEIGCIEVHTSRWGTAIEEYDLVLYSPYYTRQFRHDDHAGGTAAALRAAKHHAEYQVNRPKGTGWNLGEL